MAARLMGQERDGLDMGWYRAVIAGARNATCPAITTLLWLRTRRAGTTGCQGGCSANRRPFARASSVRLQVMDYFT